jgi:hypothetical protein
MKLSKTTWTLLGLAVLFYSFAWTKTASALALVGALFELGMYASMFADGKQRGMESTEEAKGETDNGR